jgi:galactokinase
MESMNSKKIADKFKSLFKTEAHVFRSPGRINLIGEHTDYNDGYVLPAAIDKSIIAAVNVNSQNLLRFYSIDFEQYFELKITDLKVQDHQWANYLLGVVAQFQKRGLNISGLDCVFGGDIPIGAGLSSSAALECVLAFAINKIHGFGLELMELVRLSQKAEHEYAGVNCGIMDQFASMFGKEDHGMLLDCRSLEYEYSPIRLDNYSIVLVNTNVSHNLAASEYNTRRQECEAGVEILKKHKMEITALRDVDSEVLEAHRNEFPNHVYKRCKHVVEENHRVLAARKALNEGNHKRFGQLIYDSHSGLCNDYEVSCPELDFLVELAKESGKVIGARMMGGGFGGCTINFVNHSFTKEFSEMILKKYNAHTGIVAEIYIVKICNGTSSFNF